MFQISLKEKRQFTQDVEYGSICALCVEFQTWKSTFGLEKQFGVKCRQSSLGLRPRVTGHENTWDKNTGIAPSFEYLTVLKVVLIMVSQVLSLNTGTRYRQMRR